MHVQCKWAIWADAGLHIRPYAVCALKSESQTTLEICRSVQQSLRVVVCQRTLEDFVWLHHNCMARHKQKCACKYINATVLAGYPLASGHGWGWLQEPYPPHGASLEPGLL